MTRCREQAWLAVIISDSDRDDYAAGKGIHVCCFFCYNPRADSGNWVMGKRLNGKVSIVTGASRGVGRAICVALAKEASAVVLAARAAEKLRETAEQVTAAGAGAEIVVTDLIKEDSIKHLVETTRRRFGRLDILVNNAGVTHSAALEETSTADWDRLFTVNARAPFILSREALGLLKEAESAHIVNICSIVGVKCYALQSAYTAARASGDDQVPGRRVERHAGKGAFDMPGRN
jgi:NADP-dependent 3-hydroxy acid dehydrogenase YdfG